MLLVFLVFGLSKCSEGQPELMSTYKDTVSAPRDSAVPKRINFYVADRFRIYELFNLLVIWRARLHGMTRKDKLIVVVVTSSEHAKKKMIDYLEKKKGIVGNIWFDSHGYYENGYSSYTLGEDQFNYKTINDTSFTKYLRALSPYCNDQTKVAIGSCYGGATFEKPSYKGNPASRMNGDSLMVGLAKIFPCATIYGSESWVMTKPGIFMKNSFALAGYPLGRKYKKEVYRPVWERMGIWHSYSAATGKFEKVNTLCLTRAGSIYINPVSYLDLKVNMNKVQRILEKMDRRALKKQNRQGST